MQLVANPTLSSDAKVAIEQTEPEDECVITREGPKRDALVRRFEAQHFKSLFSRNRSLRANTECRVEIVPAAR